MAFNLAVPASNNYFGASLTGTNEVQTRPSQTTLQMSVADGKKQQSAYKPVKFVPPNPKKAGDTQLPKVNATSKKRKLASASIL